VRRPPLHAATGCRRPRATTPPLRRPSTAAGRSPGGPVKGAPPAAAAALVADPRAAIPQSSADPVTARSPSLSVRWTCIPSRARSANVRAEGWPYGLSAPTDTSATRAPVAARNRGSASALPWCGTLSTSARTSTPRSRMRRSASALRSPVSRMRTPRWVIRTSRHRSLGEAAAVAISGGGASTSIVAVPTARRYPGTRVIRAARTLRASASMRPTLVSDGDRMPVATWPTLRPVSAPARPVTWSASRCDSSTSGTSWMPSRRRHRSSDTTSGPASTSTA
jgi:hypothetical protein